MLTCCLLIGLALPAQPESREVLIDRTTFIRETSRKGWATFRNLETVKGDQASGVYGLSAVSVPEAGWRIDSVAIFTTCSAPEKWVKVDHARLKVIARGKGELPTLDDDPRKGKDVHVEVRALRDGIFTIRATGLDLKLQPGDYWIGLTPISEFEKHGQGFHVLVNKVRDARYDDVARCPDGDKMGMPFLKEWNALGPGIYMPPNEHLAVQIEGSRIHQDRMLAWPASPPARQKQIHLRYATFDPLEKTPTIPADQQAPTTSRLRIVQARSTVDQAFRDALARQGAVLLQYLPDDAYVVRLDPEGEKKIADLEGVRWVGPYHPAYRLDKAVFPEPANDSFYRMTPQGEPKGMRRVRLYLFEQGDAKKRVGQAVRDAGGEIVFVSGEGKYVVALVPLDRLGTVAGQDDVSGIERVLQGYEPNGMQRDVYGGAKSRITMAQIRELCGADRLKAERGYEGLGVRVACGPITLTSLPDRLP
jgi:hypothetical protein